MKPPHHSDKPANSRNSSPARAMRSSWGHTPPRTARDEAEEEKVRPSSPEKEPTESKRITTDPVTDTHGSADSSSIRKVLEPSDKRADSSPVQTVRKTTAASSGPSREDAIPGTAGQSARASREAGPQVGREKAGSPPPAAGQPSLPSRRPRTVLWVLAFGFLLIVLGLGLLSGWVSGLDISKLEHPLPEPSFVLDAKGQPVSQLSSSRIEPVPLSQIPKSLQNAIVAVEDRRFYEHRGYDLRSMGRALWRDLQARSLDEGGSTITQQLAKNMFLSSDKTFMRKIKELGYAVKIHVAYSKDEILDLYLNSIYFGEGRWGVQGAAQHYFGKPVEKLSLPEAALLAGLPKAPTRFSPLRNPEGALERRNLVLSLMKEQEFITAADYDQAVAEPLKLHTDNGETLKGKYPAFIDFVMDEAERKYGFSEQQILTMGLRIHTTMDLRIQQAADEVFAQDSLFPESPDSQLVQAAAVVLDPAEGSIRAIVGGRGEQTYRGFNRATELMRQPGSTFKPLAVYGPALERGYTPSSPLYDGELDIAGYRPRDWDGQTRGEVSLKEAVVRSWNIPAVWLLHEIGMDSALDYLRRTGIALSEQDRHLSLALGGLSKGVSPLQMAGAYGALANQGVRHAAHAIVRITTKDGQLLAQAQPQKMTVTQPAHAYTLTTLLQEAVASGTGKAANIPGRPTAGKTGTTQLPATEEFAQIGSNGAKDAWFVGYTPELTAAVWVGYDQTDRNHYLTTSGGSVPAVLFREIMTRGLQGTAVEPFAIPPDVLRVQEEARRLEQERTKQQKEREEKEQKEKAKKEKEKEKEQKAKEKKDEENRKEEAKRNKEKEKENRR
ncbi:transglycosylase domain-containing protein [Paenibacillus puerhi]|uniref:transglycosylase domain-containing protein n=1 Tax=Paenibacillus puerhi TaxID=2692622 RepID=UPI001F2387F5|nr:PBP1A family penicillin-binding protein [Paenibacillus puerhi]